MSGLLAYARDPFDAMDDGLRWYQREMALAAFEAWEEHRAVLVVAATGLGKTQVFARVTGDYPGKVLIVAHRDELVEQARKRIEAMTGEWVEIEQGDRRPQLTTRIVVASVHTLRQQKRLERYPRDHFSLIILDEAHHYCGNTFVRPLEYFREAKVLGVTATPDRGDERAMGKTFDKVAYVMDIDEGIDQGYLVPLRGQLVTLDEIDISAVGKTGKDLSSGALDEAMVKAVEGIVRETIRLEPDRQGVCFFPGIRSAEYAAEKFNALRPESARFISAATPTEERRRIVESFRRGEFMYLCNCMIATEGFDAPSASMIVLARPTLSRSLYAQMVGRGTRVLPGLIDGMRAKAQAGERRAAIMASGKPDCMILDFVGNSGRHQLVTLEDILGGRYTDAEVKAAKKKRAEHGGDPRAALEAARAEMRKLAATLQAKVKSEVRVFDPFSAYGVDRESIVPSKDGRPPSQAQQQFLRAAGIDESDVHSLNADEAQKLVRTVQKRRQLGLATFKQLRALERFGLASPNLTLQKASVALAYIAHQGWGYRTPIDPKVLERIVHYQRQPGEEG